MSVALARLMRSEVPCAAFAGTCSTAARRLACPPGGSESGGENETVAGACWRSCVGEAVRRGSPASTRRLPFVSFHTETVTGSAGALGAYSAESRTPVTSAAAGDGLENAMDSMGDALD